MTIAGVAAITPVGRNAADACAAIRAGLSRPRSISDFDVLDEETQLEIPLTGHPIAGFAEGYNLIGFWLRVGTACLNDLMKRQQGLRTPEDWRRTALICVTPSLAGERFQGDGTEEPAGLRQAYVDPLCRQMDFGIAATHRYAISRGQAGLFPALTAARRLLDAGEVERVIVLAVDSMLDTMTLRWLADDNRLRTPANPKGLSPGEAGVAILLTREAKIDNRSGCTGAVVEAASVARDAPLSADAMPPRGQGLRQAIHDVLAETSIVLPFGGDIVADLNGEDWRACEYASALVGLRGVLTLENRLLLPCMSTGDLGAATTAVALCVAAWYLGRGCARSQRCLVVGATESGDVGAACIRAAA